METCGFCGMILAPTVKVCGACLTIRPVLRPKTVPGPSAQEVRRSARQEEERALRFGPLSGLLALSERFGSDEAQARQRTGLFHGALRGLLRLSPRVNIVALRQAALGAGLAGPASSAGFSLAVGLSNLSLALRLCCDLSRQMSEKAEREREDLDRRGIRQTGRDERSHRAPSVADNDRGRAKGPLVSNRSLSSRERFEVRTASLPAWWPDFEACPTLAGQKRTLRYALRGAIGAGNREEARALCLRAMALCSAAEPDLPHPSWVRQAASWLAREGILV